MGNAVVQNLSFEELEVDVKGESAVEVDLAALCDASNAPIKVTVPRGESADVHIALGDLLEFDLRHPDSASLCQLMRAADSKDRTHLAPIKVVKGALLPPSTSPFYGNMEVTVMHAKHGLKYFRYCVCGYLKTAEAEVGPFDIRFSLNTRSRILLAEAMGVASHHLTCTPEVEVAADASGAGAGGCVPKDAPACPKPAGLRAPESVPTHKHAPKPPTERVVRGLAPVEERVQVSPSLSPEPHSPEPA